jgi:serine/threonine protein kinase
VGGGREDLPRVKTMEGFNVHDTDDVIPEFEARYDTGSAYVTSDSENNSAEGAHGRKLNIQISRAYPILKEFSHAGVSGDVYLIDQNGSQSILKFYRSDRVPDEEGLRKAKVLSEQLSNFVIRIYEYGFDENTKRWYAMQEYAKGGALKDLAETKIDTNHLNLMVKQITEGMKFLHERNVLHLNLKPSNILLREARSPQPVFTDFSLFSIIESQDMKKSTFLKESPLYSSPELLAGVVGREADYWSLGMIILELLSGTHPLAHLGGKSIVDIFSARSITIPEHIPRDYNILLRGLLTHESKKRWGYAEVMNWLEKEKNTPVCFQDISESPEKTLIKDNALPYKFNQKEYFSIVQMIPAFLESEEAWEEAKNHLARGNISKWLLKNSDATANSQIDTITERSGGDPELALISLIYTFKHDLPFTLYGKLITIRNLYIYAGRSFKRESTRGEESIINYLLSGKLIEYYREYLMLTAKADDDLMSLFEAVRRAVYKKENYHAKLGTSLKMLGILVSPAAYMLPSKISDNLIGNLYFLAENIDMIVTRKAYDEMISDLIIPEEMKEDISKALSAELSTEYIKGLEKLRKDSLLTTDELNELQAEYIFPLWLEGDILGKDTARYIAAINLLRKLKEEGFLIKKNEFLDYFRKYFQFIRYLVDKTVASQSSQKGETLEQRWLRLMRYDVAYEDYMRVGRHIKNDVTLSMFPYIEEILKRVAARSVVSDSMNDVIAYLEALKSGEVKWDDADKQIVSEMHSLFSRSKGGPIHLLEKITEGVPGTFLQRFIKIVIGTDADERTREMELAFAGVLGGACLGGMAWLIVASLESGKSFYGPVIMGLLLGLLRKSLSLAVLCALAGFAGVFFLSRGTLIEVIYMFPISIIGAAKLGAFIGRKMNKCSFCDDVCGKYNDRIHCVLSAIEAASN